MCICKLLSLLLKILFKFPLGDAEEAKDFVIFFGAEAGLNWVLF